MRWRGAVNGRAVALGSNLSSTGLGEDAGGGKLAGMQGEVEYGGPAPDLDGREAGWGRPARAGAKQWRRAVLDAEEAQGLGDRQRGLRRRMIRPVLAVSGAEEDGNGFPVDRGRSGTATVELRGNDDLL